MQSLKKLILLAFAISTFSVLAYNLVLSPDWQVAHWPETKLRAIYIESTAKLLINSNDQHHQNVVSAVKAHDPEIEETIFKRVLISSVLTVVLTAALNLIPLILGFRSDDRVRGSQLITALQLRKIILTRLARKPFLMCILYVVLFSTLGLIAFVKTGLLTAVLVFSLVGAGGFFLVEYLQKGTLKPVKKITVGGVPIPPEVEGRHFIIEGTTGAGKSQAIYKMLIDARRRGDRALIMDIGGAYCQRFHRRGDLLLAPGEAGSIQWSPFLEIKSRYDFLELARACIPDGMGANAAFHDMSRVLFATVMEKMYAAGDYSVNRLIYLVCTSKKEELNEFVTGTPADVYTQDGGERLLQSVRSVCSTYLTAWSFLPDQGDFSLKGWIRNSRSGQCLFIKYSDNQIAVMRQLLASWLQIAITETLCLDEKKAVPTWFIADEFDSLGQVSAAKDALTKLRKYQGRCVFGVQTVAQLYATYGREIAQVLLSCLSTKLYLRCGDPDTAEYCSKSLGDEEILRQERSRSRRGLFGLGGDPSRNDAERHVTHRIVLASELENLPDLAGYLSIAGDYPTAKVKIPIPKF